MMTDVGEMLRASQSNANRVESAIVALERSVDRDGCPDRGFWDSAREARSDLRGADPMRDLDRDRLSERLDAVCDRARDAYDRSRRANATSLGSEVSSLEGMLEDFDPEAFWPVAKAMVETFKSAGPMERDDRERLWDRYGKACERAKAIAAEQREADAEASSATRASIVLEINAVVDSLESAMDVRAVGDCGRRLSTVRARMDSEPMLKSDLDLCWMVYRRSRSLTQSRRTVVLDANRELMESRVLSTRALVEAGDAEGAREAVRQCHAAMKEHPLDDDAYSSVKAALNEIWAETDDAMEELRSERRREQVQAMESSIAANEARLEVVETEMRAMLDLIDDDGDKGIADNLRREVHSRIRVSNRLRDENRELRRRIVSIRPSTAAGKVDPPDGAGRVDQL